MHHEHRDRRAGSRASDDPGGRGGGPPLAGLLTTSLLLFRTSPAGDGAVGATETISQEWQIALYLVPFAGIAFLWFLAVLRRRIGRNEDQFFSTVFLGSGLLFIAMLFAADATASAVVAIARSGAAVGDPVYDFGRALVAALFYVFAVKMSAVFMLVSSNIGRRAGALPRWFVGVGVISAIVMLFSVGFFELLALIFPAWVAVVSILLLRAHVDSWAA